MSSDEEFRACYWGCRYALRQAEDYLQSMLPRVSGGDSRLQTGVIRATLRELEKTHALVIKDVGSLVGEDND